MLWGAAFGMLSWWASKTLTHRCKIEDWNDETGVMVCRIYKALYAFGCCGLYVSKPCPNRPISPEQYTNNLPAFLPSAPSSLTSSSGSELRGLENSLL